MSALAPTVHMRVVVEADMAAGGKPLPFPDIHRVSFQSEELQRGCCVRCGRLFSVAPSLATVSHWHALNNRLWEVFCRRACICVWSNGFPVRIACHSQHTQNVFSHCVQTGGL